MFMGWMKSSSGMAACGGWKVHGMDECSLDDCLVTGNSMGWMNPVVEMRGGGGVS